MIVEPEQRPRPVPGGSSGLGRPRRVVPNHAKRIGAWFLLTGQSLDGANPWTLQAKHVFQRRIQL